MPQACAGCGRPDVALCRRCRAGLIRLRPPLCALCGAPVAWPVDRCRDCAGRRLAFARARAAVAYEGVAVRIVHGWKEGGRRRLARELAELVIEAVPEPEAAAVAPVPAVSERLLWRGHNPAATLAAELSARWGLPLLERLLVRRRTPPQRGLSRDARRRNVAHAFAVPARAPGSVVLVDDVYTTGSTVAAAATALRRAGARRVEVVAFARALRGRG